MQHTVNENNVLDIIKRGENETTEFKVGHVPAASICKVIASFGNSRGGILIVVSLILLWASQKRMSDQYNMR